MGLNRHRFIHNSSMAATPNQGATAAQVDTCTPNFLIQEYNGNDLHRDIFVEPIVLENGFTDPPTNPSLGIKLDDRVVQRQFAT